MKSVGSVLVWFPCLVPAPTRRIHEITLNNTKKIPIRVISWIAFVRLPIRHISERDVYLGEKNQATNPESAA